MSSILSDRQHLNASLVFGMTALLAVFIVRNRRKKNISNEVDIISFVKI